ncbi:MAG: DegT/DnrJ/EryC1/StrS family aminotransferase [Eubacteriales bacterium]|jgi:dTDP-4-amino-4,6-dideoxygalactose transaminase|nr:DegT/DnrJ/EryC1/StrS family aminotransferase [Clostridiales bacterium]
MYRIGKEEIEALARVIESRDLFKINSGACEVLNFEAELCEKLGVKHSILMTSGKAALISGLVGMGVGPGDEVIVPAYTYIATAIAVTAVGAIPVIADIDESLTLDPADFERKITKYTKAVIPVHIQGFPCDMDKINEIAKKHGVYVLEDACQSVGGSYKGKRLGTVGDAGAFSFNYYKVITSGEGGALMTDCREIFERALIYHDSSAIAYFGNQLESFTTEQFCGNEFRVSEFTGAIMRAQLKKLDSILYDLRRNKAYLLDKLSGKYNFIHSNDILGDCGTTLAFWFDTEAEAVEFKRKADTAGYPGTRPIDTGKHVYTNWTPIMNKKGAFHPAFDPFKMEANKDLNHNYTPDMCEKSLEYLKRAVYIMIDPDMDERGLDRIVDALK